MLVPSSLLPHVSCKHRFCAACWVAHVALGVRERRSELRCMGERCGEKLADKDVRRLAPELHAAWTQIKFADRMEHLRNIFLAGDAFSEWAKRNTQACPRCHVLVQRSEGCAPRHRAASRARRAARTVGRVSIRDATRLVACGGVDTAPCISRPPRAALLAAAATTCTACAATTFATSAARRLQTTATARTRPTGPYSSRASSTSSRRSSVRRRRAKAPCARFSGRSVRDRAHNSAGDEVPAKAAKAHHADEVLVALVHDRRAHCAEAQCADAPRTRPQFLNGTVS